MQLTQGEMRMSGFIIGALAVGAFWLYFTFKSNANAHNAFNALDEAEGWFQKNGIVPSTVKFSSYSDSNLSKHSDANIIIGFGETNTGERKGIVLEIVEGKGVVEGVFIDPPALTSHHRSVSISAKSNGTTMIEAMIEKARLHKQEYSGAN